MRVLIIENDNTAYRHLVKQLDEISPGNKIVGHCTRVKNALTWFQNHEKPDLVFSVINLPDGLSFEVFGKLDLKVPVIFTCAQEKYAIDAFKANGIYYILKPVKREDLKEALARYEKNFQVSPSDQVRKTVTTQERFIVNIGRQLKLIQAEDIAYFYTRNKIVYLVSFDGSKYVTKYSLEYLESHLNPAVFFRINRQFIINLLSITKMIPASKSRLQVVLRPKTEYTTTTSFGRVDKFYKWMLGAE